MVSRWSKALREYGDACFRQTRASNETKPDAELRSLAKENQYLERILSKKDLDIAILKDALKNGPWRAEKMTIAGDWISQGHRWV